MQIPVQENSVGKEQFACLARLWILSELITLLSLLFFERGSVVVTSHRQLCQKIVYFRILLRYLETENFCFQCAFRSYDIFVNLNHEPTVLYLLFKKNNLIVMYEKNNCGMRRSR